MSLETKPINKHEADMTISEILFGTLLGVGAVSCIWLSTTLIIYLYQNLY